MCRVPGGGCIGELRGVGQLQSGTQQSARCWCVGRGSPGPMSPLCVSPTAGGLAVLHLRWSLFAKDCSEASERKGGQGHTGEMPSACNAPFPALLLNTLTPSSALSPRFSPAWLLALALASPGGLLPSPSPGMEVPRKASWSSWGIGLETPSPVREGDKQERVKRLGPVAFDGG